MTLDELLLPALRQYRHNDGDGFVFGYDMDEVKKILNNRMGDLEGPRLVNRADGVDGHYCIRRIQPCGTAEYWDQDERKWSAFGTVINLKLK